MMRVVAAILLFTTTVVIGSMCPFHSLANPAAAEVHPPVQEKAAYHKYLKSLDVKALYNTIAGLAHKSQECWPADGPQDGDKPNYAGLFGRLAWHCSGTFSRAGVTPVGGCEGGRQRFAPEADWRDNGNLDQARALLGSIKNMPEFAQLSWGDLFTFAGTVGIKSSGAPIKKFCFGRIDDVDGTPSLPLGVEKPNGANECPNKSHWAEQDKSDNARCHIGQEGGRNQASHSVGLIYVYPEGPKLAKDQPQYDAKKAHNRSPSLSAAEIRDTFNRRMGWTDQETVAIIGGGHTIGRAHGQKCPDGQVCKGADTKTSGFEGAWTRTPSRWNYDYFAGSFGAKWEPAQSPAGNDQWSTKSGEWRNTFRLTSDMALMHDAVYKEWALKYLKNHALFDDHFDKAWFKLVHQSHAHPNPNDLEADAGKCTTFDFVKSGGHSRRFRIFRRGKLLHQLPEEQWQE